MLTQRRTRRPSKRAFVPLHLKLLIVTGVILTRRVHSVKRYDRHSAGVPVAEPVRRSAIGHSKPTLYPGERE